MFIKNVLATVHYKSHLKIATQLRLKRVLTDLSIRRVITKGDRDKLDSRSV